MQIRIQTKTKKRPKVLNLSGEFRKDVSRIYLESSDGVQDFLKTIQSNQKLELFVDDEKIGNIRNPQLIDENILTIEGNFQIQTVVKDITPKVIKSSTDIIGGWGEQNQREAHCYISFWRIKNDCETTERSFKCS